MSLALERGAALSFLLLAAALPWSIAPMSIAVALSGALTLACWWRPGGARWVRTPVDPAAIVWLIALGIAALAGEDPAGSVNRVTKGFLLAIVPLAAYHGRDPKLARRAIAVLLVSAAVATVFALVKFAMQGGAFPVRVRGAVGHPLTYGGQAMLLAVLAGAILLRSRDRRWKGAAGALLLLLAPALLGSYTRSAWIGTLVGFAILIGFTRARWLPALLGALLVLVLVLPGGYRERALSVFHPHGVWNRERIILWDAGWRMFRDHPVTGVGLEDLKPWVARYRSPEAHEPPHGHMHNVYLQVLVTMGVIGFAAFVYLVTALWRTAARRLRVDARSLDADPFGMALRIGTVAALAGFLVAGLFEWNFGDEELLDFLFTLIGLAWAASAWRHVRPVAPPSS
ncbi:MAG TPA: O-antigen ligase family protein [Candidatus Eisenbacteria bacterium]|nr:O-antigen ligase family protein [Candidatus Eisenbacteria bacterium]